MSDLSSAKFCVDDAQIRRIIAPALEKIGSRRFPGRTEAARKAAFEKYLTDTLIPIVMQINCYDSEDPKKVAQTLKVFLQVNFLRATNVCECNHHIINWIFGAVIQIIGIQVGFSIFAASMVLLNNSVDFFFKTISLSRDTANFISGGLNVIGLVFLALGYCHGSIERNQVYATDAGLAIIVAAFCFYLLSFIYIFNRRVHYKSDSEVATLLTEFSESTSLQGYLNAAQEEVDGYLRDAKFKMVKEILKAVCDKLDSQVFQVVPSVSQNPLSINSDQAGFGAEELSRGLERAPNARPSALLFSSPTSDLSYYALCNRD